MNGRLTVKSAWLSIVTATTVGALSGVCTARAQVEPTGEAVTPPQAVADQPVAEDDAHAETAAPPEAAAEGGSVQDAEAPGEVARPVERADALAPPGPAAPTTPPATPPTDPAVADDTTDEPTAPARGPQGVESSGLSAASRASSVSPTAEGLSWEVPLAFSQSFNLRGFRPAAQLTYDPTYTWSLSASPRWNVAERVTLGARQDLTIELTESDVTSKPRQVWLDDTRLDARYTLASRPRGVSLTWLALVRLPTSLVSQGARRSLNLGAGVLAIRPFDVLSGLVLSGYAAYRAWLSSSDVVRTRRREAYACDLSGLGSTTACEQAGSVATTIGTFTLAGQASLIPRPRWTLTLGLAFELNHAHRLADACVDVATSPDPVCLGDGRGNHLRKLTEFSLSVGYDFREYLTLSLAYITLAYHPDPDGERDSVLWNELSSLSLTLSFRIGGFVAARRADP